MFNNIIGNEQNKKWFESTIKENKVAHSYIFVGKESIGKKLFAKEFAKSVLCIDEKKPCNNCKSCIQFDTGNNPDFKLIEPEGNTIKIDQIRNIVKNVYEKPIISNKIIKTIYTTSNKKKTLNKSRNSATILKY